MGFTDLTNITIKESGPNFEKFDVEKNDKALIHIPDGGVVQHFVHVLHRDAPVMVERNGRKVPQWSRESFAGTFICTGDFETVGNNPSHGDPTNCPACRSMNKEPRLVERPKRTFAMNIVRYATQKRSYDLRNNNLEVQVWRHADTRKLEPIIVAANQLKNEGKTISEIDFAIEADNSDWKKYTIVPTRVAQYTQNGELQSAMDDAKDSLFSSETLDEACGKKLSADELQSEINRLEAEYRLESAPAEEEDLFAKSSSSSSDDGASEPAGVTASSQTQASDLDEDDVNELEDFFS